MRDRIIIAIGCVCLGVFLGFFVNTFVKNDKSSNLDAELINARADYYYQKILEEIYLTGQNQTIVVYPKRVNENDVETLSKMLSDSLNLPYDEVKSKIENQKREYEYIAENVDSKTINSLKYRLSREFATEEEGNLLKYFSFHLAPNEEQF